MSNSTWSKEEDRKLIRGWLLESKTQRALSESLEKSKSAVTRRIAHLGLSGEKGNISLYSSITNTNPEPLLKPVEIKLPPIRKRKFDSADYLSIHYSDIHYPFQDQRAVDILYGVTMDLQPQEVYCQGDILDFWQLSNHRPPDERRLLPYQIDIQGTLELAGKHFAEMKRLSGAKRLVFMHGNHEDRFDRLLLDMQRQPRLRHMLRMPLISKVLNTSYISGADQLGYESYPYTESPILILNNRLVVIHGYKATKWTGSIYLNTYGKNVIYGHDHRVQVYSRRDLVGTNSAWGLGCLCDLNPHYDTFPMWQQGFALIWWRKDQDDWYFHVSQVRINEGRAVVNGKYYKENLF